MLRIAAGRTACSITAGRAACSIIEYCSGALSVSYREADLGSYTCSINVAATGTKVSKGLAAVGCSKPKRNIRHMIDAFGCVREIP
ncbi:hypothetical protein P775_28710 [Puniceibacterium antarcticum]|uniref:Uncharacterized protein n=1 Tax=Puniceibacterium antarcticum TaxID=1206336 RepID=A0A2G8QR25_9RHOB|nr:hypothetical protein P775_28710 [Puniceibacterium antarcticum]